ncbi:hypothetical protein MK786_12625 [Microbacterium sp. CFH 31415]|uniref:hypothetical protein n=1 Tax=Microbacterium sp. CFH 31415 TaxID=2921732 RepID=UPI001F14892E|nr:hypothetical protein [Microbacterium sp. CFH 31415]MCH6231587.1 hypothetical protein [Microbacterium sp. CFH 31415]
MRRMLRPLSALCIGVAAAGLTACGGELIQQEQCVDWVWFETPLDAADDAHAVAIGRVTGQAGTVSSYGETSNVWTFEVEEWVAGDGADVIEVVSLPRTCETGSPYPDGDPLDTDADVMVFLRQQDADSAQTITGLQGVIRGDGAAEVPDAWPDEP